MAILHILMIGHAEALAHSRAQEIKTQLSRRELTKIVAVALPEDLAKIGALRQKFDVWIFVSQVSHVPNYPVWKAHLDRVKDPRPVIAIVSDRALPSSLVEKFRPEFSVLGKDPVLNFCSKILNLKASPAKAGELTNRAETISQTKMESALDSADQQESQTNALEEIVAGLETELSQEEAVKAEAQKDPLEQNSQNVALHELETEHLNLAAAAEELENLEPDEKVDELQGQTKSLREEGFSKGTLSKDDKIFLEEGVSVSELEEASRGLGEKPPSVESSTKNESEENAFAISKAVSQYSTDVTQAIESGIAALNPEKNSHEFETLNRFALLKEREAREREATIQVLNKQLGQIKEKLARSESERRRLQVALDEAQTNIRALEEARDQQQNQLRKLDSQHGERQKAIQAKLDNAQFSATRAEKKLEEFKERVRNDILRIRLRERELGNKLELQKRDAEALLTSKDERLLEQKREIDRLEYEMELLKERMIENTARAEERAAKLSRALQSLRMAQGMLTGIEEEVIPTADSLNDDSGQDAA